MTDDQPDIDDRAAGASDSDAPAAVASAEPGEPIYERDEGWIDDAQELPPRPRRRLLTPIPLTLLAILAIACGFIGGVLVEKGQGGSASGAAGDGSAFASRLAALSGKSGAAGTGSASSSGTGLSSAGGSGAAAQGGFGVSASGRASGTAGGAGATVGQVAYISKGTLYVTTSEGNTVKVTAAPGATVTKSVKTTADGIHPGETVVIAGTASADGAIAAQSIRAGSAGAGGLAGTAGLLGGSSSSSGAARSGSSSSGTSTSGGSGEQALFGKG